MTTNAPYLQGPTRTLGDKIVGPGHPVFITGEIGNQLAQQVGQRFAPQDRVHLQNRHASEQAHLAGVATLAANHSIDRYFAHRKEDRAKLDLIRDLGLQVVRPELPLELVARRQPIGETLISFPSTVVHTLPLVLSDTSARLLVCDIADDWYTSQAPIQPDRFLDRVTTSARDAHGLLSVAC